MLNKIINFSLHNRLLVMIMGVLLLCVGTYTAQQMEVDVFPDLNAPTVVVMTEAPGMAAEEVERTVSFPLETAVNGATDVRRVRSSSTTGFSVLWVEFDWGTDIYKARQIVSEKLAAVSATLPDNVGNPTLGSQSSILGELMIVGLTSDSTSLEELRTIADWNIRPRLLSTGGVAQVTVIGGDIREYQILLDPIRMKNYNVSLDEVLAVVDNLSRNSNGGVLNQYGNEYIIRGMLLTTSAEEMGKAVIKTVDGNPILLEHIADVRTGAKAPKMGIASEKGKPAVLMTVTKQPNTNSLELTAQLDKAIAEIQTQLPADIHLSTDSFRQARFIEGSIDNIQKSLFEGALFVVIVLFFFLMNVRTTVISLIALPLSLLVAILALKLMGLTINTMSLGGMAIAIGSLVDDAIIDVENVFKRLRENHRLPKEQRRPTLRVVYDASTEIRTSIVHATIITIVAFIPLFFLSGMEGRMLRPLGISFIVSLFASMIVAVTLTPVLCSYLLTGEKVLRKSDKEPFLSRWLKHIYKPALEWVLVHKRIVLGSTIGLFVVAVAIFLSLGRNFLPPFNEGAFTINVATMPGISLEESDKVGRNVEEILLEIPEIQTVVRKTGRAELDEHALGVNASEIEAPYVLDERSKEELIAEIRQKLSVLKGVNIEIGQPISHRIDAMLSGTKANIAIKLFGPDLNQLFNLGNQIKTAISGVEGVADLNVEQQVERPQLQIKPKREMLARYGIPLTEFSEFVEVALGGRVISQVFDQGRSFDVTVKVNDINRSEMERIGNLTLDAANGQKVPLNYVAELISSSGPNNINRENAQRKIVVSANVAGRDLRGVVNDIQNIVKTDVPLPEGYHVEYGGQFESEQSASRILLFTSIISLLIIFLLLFQEFKKLSMAGIIMINLPLALIGGVFSLWITAGDISIPAVIGFISLLGIATRNGILLVSHYNNLRAEGVSLHNSIVQGSIDRLNPILMTALSSALALIPLALGGDLAGNEIQSPMAKVILGGLLSSTLLNGFIIPAVYLILNRKHENV